METKASRDLRLGGRLWEWNWGEAEVSALNSPDHKLYLILQGKVHLSSWYTETNLDCTWAIKTSPNGWTDNQTALEWIQHFDKYTYDQRVDVYRMIVLDGHESHFSAQFEEFCKEKNIIALCLPTHSSHITQPLDVGCFSILKRSYSKELKCFVKAHIVKVQGNVFAIDGNLAR
jgi:hypothetical protein